MVLAATMVFAAPVVAANGDNLRTIIADRHGTNCASYDAAGDHASVGVGIGFDGTNLLISCYSDNTVTAVSPADGSQAAVHRISGASSLGALAWDSGRHVLWACSGFSEVGTIDLATDVFTPRFSTPGCFDGLAYDGSDDSVWTSPDATSSISHSTSSGSLIGVFTPSLGNCGNSGIAVGGANLYLANDGCSQIYVTPKAFSGVALFATFPRRIEDMECDNLTFAAAGHGAIWSIDAYDNILNAWEIPVGDCQFGGGASSNTPPTPNSGGPYRGSEGAAIPISGTATDPDAGDTVTTTWSYSVVSADPGATCSFADAAALATTVTCTDNGDFKLTLSADDGVNAPVTSDATLSVANVNPVVSISTPSSGALEAVGSSIVVSAPFTDAGTNDTHTCTVDPGAGSGPHAGSVSETPGSGTCSGTLTYGTAGIYTIQVAVTDDNGGIGTATVDVVVYDPSAGFVTGGGWINSPAGAYAANPSLSGRANFGFVSRYQRGASVPTGQTEFQFQTAALDFHSDSYQWLVVNQGGTNAQFKGTGTINGAGSYDFMIWAGDGSPDTFRIQITDPSKGNAVVYDNGVKQALGGGGIVIHTK
jgi:hypothetical protein